MATTLTLQLRADEDVKIQAQPLTAQAFSPYGSVVANPRPDVHPSAYAAHAASLPPNAKAANAGTAIQYRDAGVTQSLFQGGRGKPLMSIFACAASEVEVDGSVAVDALERHPFTTQTFSPLSSPASTYLVIVAPSLPEKEDGGDAAVNVKLPRWHGMPDLSGLRAFVASASQAVTYAAGTWHAPMKVLGESGQRLDFVVMQFVSGVAAEDCQLVEMVSAEQGASIQSLYEKHRSDRCAASRERLLSPTFTSLSIDRHLLRLERPDVEPGFRDDRHCLVFWARPPIHTLRLADEIQRRLRAVAPNIWMMPTYRMHLTTLELAFSKTADEIAALLNLLRPAAADIGSYTHSHRARLVKPRVSYDLSAFAVSWLPANGEPTVSPAPTPPDKGTKTQDDAYTYHHLRRDVSDLVREADVPVASRYQVPSAHVTLGRFLDDADHDTVEKREAWAAAVDRVNDWLETEVWDKADAEFVGEWIVGQEKGLDLRAGTLWYGGGRTVLMGEGF
ncbi:hypothetical protein L249_5100 [Ophiocordyceps polyrhachis-furcata BCC 54312]|uniref:Ureidoglycolate hydrolase n=1 Tax=Ophiocordyceps polyrhachis-furcata BCC 54312 TaxID=1330021 RepID=A0A367L3R7_9HYPO|nr:hypothetical protein L249_5100 [Ophiocordyceps polyrhachis-furcata BCC 54312]